MVWLHMTLVHKALCCSAVAGLGVLFLVKACPAIRLPMAKVAEGVRKLRWFTTAFDDFINQADCDVQPYLTISEIHQLAASPDIAERLEPDRYI